MNPNEKELLQKTHDLSEENNKILRSIRRSNRLSSFFRVIYWIIIIVAAFGTYWFIQPYLNMVSNVYSGIQNDLKTVKNATTKITDPINNLLDKVR
ncbi:MAG: hypothetical protein WC631_01815 [Candidatus Paceibacterota bacterium]|jgi:hypothetical protein